MGLGRDELRKDAEETDSESDSEAEESETVKVSRLILEELERRYYAERNREEKSNAKSEGDPEEDTRQHRVKEDLGG